MRAKALSVLVLIGLFAAMAPAPARAQVPPSLTGEQLLGLQGNGSASCDPSGISTISYQTQGAAFGPYSGTFTEQGTVVIAGGMVTGVDASFAIDSPAGQVVGTKTLRLGETGGCINNPPESPSSTKVFAGNATLTYQATITTPIGTFGDSGRAFFGISGQCLVNETNCIVQTSENFTSESDVLPVDSTGKATGGGQIGPPLAGGTNVRFGFEAKRTADPTRLQGRCVVIDPASDVQVRCLDVTTYHQIGSTATWTGTATVEGDLEEYRIVVQDNGEPNQGIDTFSIKTDSFAAAGNVTRGNVQLHD
jgi:hypothetical protein